MKRLLHILAIVRFGGFFLGEVIRSNGRLIVDILGPMQRLRPGFIELPLEGLTPRQRWILATCITMTPGTLSLGQQPENDCLRIHALHADNGEAIRQDLQTRFIERIRDAF